MNDSDFQAIIAGDDRSTEITETAGRIAAYYTTLVDAGMTPKRAADMTHDYSSMVLARHFGDVLQSGHVYVFGEDD